jgi:hypothetical protein
MTIEQLGQFDAHRKQGVRMGRRESLYLLYHSLLNARMAMTDGNIINLTF